MSQIAVLTCDQRNMLKTFLSAFKIARSGSVEERDELWENVYSAGSQFSLNVLCTSQRYLKVKRCLGCRRHCLLKQFSVGVKYVVVRKNRNTCSL
jgi:hypothetical protein